MADKFSLSSASALFKIKYDKLSDNTYNSSNVLLGRVKKSYDFVGKQCNISIPQSFAGGVGSGSLPTANTADYSEAVLTAKKMYSVIQIDRESIKAAMKDEGAFVRATAHQVSKGVESWMRNMSRSLFHDGSGSLGAIASSGVTDNSGGNYTLVISDASWKEASLEEKDIINIEAANTDTFEIEEVDPDNKSVTVQRLTGSQVPADTDVLFMQNSEDADPEGLAGILDATSGSLYGVTVARRWKAYQLAAASATISSDLLNKAMLNVEKKCGKVPNLIVTSYVQYEKMLNMHEDHKRYEVSSRYSKGKFSFSGLEFMSTKGTVGIFAERFCPDDRVYLLNDNYIKIHHRPQFGWFSDDGTVLLRDNNSDSYSARYGGYLQTYICPSFQGVISGLNVN